MRIVWSAPALDDLRNISGWLEREATSQVAVRVLADVQRKADFLCECPRAGRPGPEGHRILVMPLSGHLIRYAVAGDAVQVIRVHHERENWQVEV